MRDNSELKRLRSEEIRDVEVINNPGAQYDATVRAVVRIRTVRQQGDGLSLDLTLSDEHDLRYDFDRPQAKIGVCITIIRTIVSTAPSRISPQRIRYSVNMALIR